MLPHPSGADLIGSVERGRPNAPGRTYLTDRYGSHLEPGGWAEASWPRGVGQRAGPDTKSRAGRGASRGRAGAAARDAVGPRRRSAAGSTALKTPR